MSSSAVKAAFEKHIIVPIHRQNRSTKGIATGAPMVSPRRAILRVIRERTSQLLRPLFRSDIVSHTGCQNRSCKEN